MEQLISSVQQWQKQNSKFYKFFFDNKFIRFIAFYVWFTLVFEKNKTWFIYPQNPMFIVLMTDIKADIFLFLNVSSLLPN